MAKMNWSRVAKESVAQRRGSTWVSPLPSIPESSRKKRSKSLAFKPQPPASPPMPGCTCGKRAGFTDRHKKTCPCRYAEALNEGTSAVLSEPQRRLYTPCPYGCGLVREEKLASHIRLIHPIGSSLATTASETRVTPPEADAMWRSVSAGAFESNRRKH